ncbi:MAG: potassium-transporting ATPase subunit F [Phycisphaerae bacterium]
MTPLYWLALILTGLLLAYLLIALLFPEKFS